MMEQLIRKYRVLKAFLKAVREGSMEEIGQILDSAADFSGLVNFIKCSLAESANGEVAKLLIARGADVKHVECVSQKTCRSPLVKILKKRRNCKDNCVVQVIQVLLENGASVNDKCGDGKTPLMLAAVKEGNMSVLQLLLDHGAELGEVDEEGNTALMHAASEGCFQNVSFLLQFIKNRPDVINLQNAAGLTALMCAVRFRRRNSAIIRELIDQGGDVNIKDKKGNTALLHLLLLPYQDEYEIVKSFIRAGVDVNWQNNDGLSPLMVAVQNYLIDTMFLLVDLGAEINAVSKRDVTKTALSHFEYRGNNVGDSLVHLAFFIDRGAHASYMEATALHRMILFEHLYCLTTLIRYGLGPASVFVNCKPSASCPLYKLMREYKMLPSTCETDITEYFSPLSAALCIGYDNLARWFIQHLFLTQYDITSLTHNMWLRQHLERLKDTECLGIMNEIATKPMSLFNLSFVAVTAAVGASPGREIRVSKLPLPECIKDKLLFKSFKTPGQLSFPAPRVS